MTADLIRLMRQSRKPSLPLLILLALSAALSVVIYRSVSSVLRQPTNTEQLDRGGDESQFNRYRPEPSALPDPPDADHHATRKEPGDTWPRSSNEGPVDAAAIPSIAFGTLILAVNARGEAQVPSAVLDMRTGHTSFTDLRGKIPIADQDATLIAMSSSVCTSQPIKPVRSNLTGTIILEEKLSFIRCTVRHSGTEPAVGLRVHAEERGDYPYAIGWQTLRLAAQSRNIIPGLDGVTDVDGNVCLGPILAESVTLSIEWQDSSGSTRQFTQYLFRDNIATPLEVWLPSPAGPAHELRIANVSEEPFEVACLDRAHEWVLVPPHMSAQFWLEQCPSLIVSIREDGHAEGNIRIDLVGDNKYEITRQTDSLASVTKSSASGPASTTITVDTLRWMRIPSQDISRICAEGSDVAIVRADGKLAVWEYRSGLDCTRGHVLALDTWTERGRPDVFVLEEPLPLLLAYSTDFQALRAWMLHPSADPPQQGAVARLKNVNFDEMTLLGM